MSFARYKILVIYKVSYCLIILYFEIFSDILIHWIAYTLDAIPFINVLVKDVCNFQLQQVDFSCQILICKVCHHKI